MLWHQYCHPVKKVLARTTPYYERLMSALRGHMEAAAKWDYRCTGVRDAVPPGENDYGITNREIT